MAAGLDALFETEEMGDMLSPETLGGVKSALILDCGCW